MADQWIATTHIKHGNADGTITQFQEGAPVSLPPEEMDKLIEAGSVVREEELEYMKMNVPGGVTNSFNPDDLPDTPAGKAVREALEKLRKEQQEVEAQAAKDRMEAAKRAQEDADKAPGDDGDTTAGAGEKKGEESDVKTPPSTTATKAAATTKK